MATSSHMSLLILLTLVALTPSTSQTQIFNDILPVFGLPRGLIPQPMESYRLTPTGYLSINYTIHYTVPCYVKFILLNWYDVVFTGTISPGKITGITGHRDQFPDGEWQDMYSVELVDNDTALFFTFEKDSGSANISVFQDIQYCQDAPFANPSKNLISQLPLAAK